MSAAWIPADWPAPDSIIAGTTLRNGDIASLRLPGEPCWLKQVHGADVVAVGHYDSPPDADASVGRQVGDVCVVRTADCLPVLFCATDGSEIAAAHAGWRGLAAGVLEATIAEMGHAPRDLLAWMGPAISQPAFEVGGEVRDALMAQDPGAAACFVANSRGRWQADLYKLASRRLSALGVSRLYGGGFCTYADTERFFSYRRKPDCGRMISFVARRS
ncbi:MAG: peptidoglycan editing factor PgeF [Gammaproteobacteria bacterium]|nr:peptidoglycan editing factor PgeF [Gammaproteobacteria bacterium]MBT8111451.1 peptidoglycan editing factor PgeF [Gammaproteobacteria bacterium]NNL46149.1 peptidoglycan editing factor PgeF [Woeseiaceae bacterium]